MNSSESELCCNPLCQLYDPMSAISFMRECISEPMNPGPLFNHKKQLSIHFISVLDNHLVRLRAQSKFIFTLQVVRRGTRRIYLHIVPREFDIKS
jgi:hypothetical protein